jgi:hypothetical protein
MNVKKFLTSFVILSIVFFYGCGLKFKDEMVNLGLPDDWKYRTVIKNTADLRFNMTKNVGLLVTQSIPSGTVVVLGKPILPKNFTAREDIIKDGVVYSSKITQGASLQGGYLAFAADLSLSQAVDYRIVDISRVEVPWNEFPDAEIRAAAATPNPNNVKRLWIQSLLLSRILSQNYTELKCDASGSGPAFQVGGKCFNSTGTEVNDFAIGVVFLDIDKYVKNSPGTAPSKAIMGFPLPSAREFISVEPPISEIRNILK